ncbi:MAG: four helix bundle protein [Paludibacteraceae bacterium]|nr:four helix bundle protein [Paludibacteraceae bacterium]
MGDMREYNDIFRERTKKLALEIVREMAKVKFSDEVSVIRKQIIRSATSVAANYRAVCRARSERERYAKMCIVVEEADETAFWLELIEELEILPIAKVNEFKNETEEILKVMSSYKKKLSKTL